MKICTWPGQFIGFSAKTRSSSVSSPATVTLNMLSRYQPQWPEVSHSALVEHLRRVDLLIALLVEAAAHVADQALEHLPALGVPEHDARPLLLEMEQVHLAAEPAMVALLGLLQHVEIGVELRLVGPGRAVDARQHRVVAVAAPIGAGHLHQLEGVADLAGRGHVRAAAEVEPVALRVDLEILVFGNGVDQLDLVALALVAKHFLGAVARSQTSLVKGRLRAMISRIFFSIAGKSSGVNGSLRAKS